LVSLNNKGVYIDVPRQRSFPKIFLLRSFETVGAYTHSPYKRIWLVKLHVKIRVIFGVRFERRSVDKKTNLHKKWNKL